MPVILTWTPGWGLPVNLTLPLSAGASMGDISESSGSFPDPLNQQALPGEELCCSEPSGCIVCLSPVRGSLAFVCQSFLPVASQPPGLPLHKALYKR